MQLCLNIIGSGEFFCVIDSYAVFLDVITLYLVYAMQCLHDYVMKYVFDPCLMHPEL
jgi:hypothetical protein